MNRQIQVGLLKRLLHYVDTRTTSMAMRPANDVSVYTDAERLTREAADPVPPAPDRHGLRFGVGRTGSFRTDDYAGVPVLVVRGRDGKTARVPECVPAPAAKVADGLRARLAVLMHLIMHGLRSFGKVMGSRRALLSDVRPERSSLAELPLCEKHGLVWVIPTPAADGSTDFDIDAWLGGLGPELASFDSHPGRSTTSA